MRHRDARGRRHRDRTRDAGHDLAVDAGFDAGEQLFGAATEDERVATFEPHHAFSLLRKGNQQRIDLVLRQRVVVRSFAGLDHLDIRRKLVEQSSWAEPIDDNNVGLGQQSAAANGDEVGVARAAADKGDPARPVGPPMGTHRQFASSRAATARRHGSPPPAADRPR